MRIKTWVNDRVKEFVNKNWPNKSVRPNYTNDSWQTRDWNRWIQVSTPIDDTYIHYEIICDHVELHFELSESKEQGITGNQELIDYLEKATEQDFNYEWVDSSNGCNIKCIYLPKINWIDDLLENLEEVITKFDKLISEYLNQNKDILERTKLECNKTAPLPESDVDLFTLSLRDVFLRYLNIPDYQRIYCWDETNVKCLLDDLYNHYGHSKDYRNPYRLGAIILHYHDEKYDIIDGQQRLVTLSLLLDKLGKESCLMDQKFESSIAQQYIGYNKYIIDNYLRRHIREKASFANSILDSVEFSVLILQNSTLDLAYTFFSNENSRGVSLSDYDLLKAHHLRFIPEIFEQQSRKAADTWNEMMKEGKENITDSEPYADFEKTLDFYLFNLRHWMRKDYQETEENDRHVKNEFEAAPIMPELPPFGERFFFNEPIQGGTHFFSYVDIHLQKYKEFIRTQAYVTMHNNFLGNGSIQWYRNAIEALSFCYYEKFGEHCLVDAMILIMRCMLQNRYEVARVQKDTVYQYVAKSEITFMIDQATSPTFFLAEMSNIIRDYPIYYLQDLKPIQRNFRRCFYNTRNGLVDKIYVESIKKIN